MSLSIYCSIGHGYFLYGDGPEKRYPLILAKCFPIRRIIVRPMACFPSTPTEIWLEFRKVQGNVTVVLDIIPPTQPVSDVHHTSVLI